MLYDKFKQIIGYVSQRIQTRKEEVENPGGVERKGNLRINALQELSKNMRYRLERINSERLWNNGSDLRLTERCTST